MYIFYHRVPIEGVCFLKLSRNRGIIFFKTVAEESWFILKQSIIRVCIFFITE